MTERDREPEAELRASIRRHHARRERSEREGEPSLGKNLSMMGAFGWLIVLSSVLGLLAGRWLDRLAGTRMIFTGGSLCVGTVLGAWLVWRRMNEP